MESKFFDILSRFDISIKEEDNVRPYGDGHINDTYLVSTESGRYILQRIKTTIFKEPALLMENVVAVCDAIIARSAGREDAKPLTPIRAKDGLYYVISEEGDFYRLYVFIESRSFNAVESPEQLTEAGHAFGRFQNDLADFPAHTLHETIRDFHNTPVRLQNLRAAIARNAAGRRDEVQAEIAYALSFADRISQVTDGLADGSIPLRVTHNDTKLNNVLFHPKKDVCISVIDLDTVMPGSLLYDFGDNLRFAASSAAEDETDLGRVWCRLDLFEAFARGFLAEMLPSMTTREIELLPFSVQLMTYECGIRFLTDHLDGDVYFKIHHPNHNLERARNQLHLVADIEKKLPEMRRIISTIVSEEHMKREP